MIDTCTDTYTTLAVAIQQHIPILADYNGQRRLLCPHAIGSKKGHTNVLCYQSDGGSNSGLSHPGSGSNWRCLRVDRLSDVEFCPFEPWATGGNHSCPNNCIDDVDVEA
jgi:hypothetical protein